MPAQPEDVEKAVDAMAATIEASLGSAQLDDEQQYADIVIWLSRARVREATGWNGIPRRAPFDTTTHQHGYVIWPPVPRENVVPILLGARYVDSEFSIYLLLLRSSATESIEPLCIRFETPHDPGDGTLGRHDFHHAQLMSGFLGDSEPRFAQEGAWVPSSQPSFPVQAGNAYELLWSAAVTIYGRRSAHLPFESSTDLRDDLSEYLRKPGPPTGAVVLR